MEKEFLNSDSDIFLAKWLGGELTDKELKDLVSKEDYAVYLKLRKGLEISEKLNGPIDATFVKIQNRIQSKNKKVRPLFTNWSIGIAASILVILGLFTFLKSDEISIETGFGESKAIVLLDGSEVILNSKSQITYSEDNWEENRTLHLNGEAYFKVAKGKTFTVETDNGSVTVLGTKFNVNSTYDFFDVICYEGEVGVKTLESNHLLSPTNSVRKVNGYPTETSKISDTKPTWVNGESTFKSVPLRYVIKALEDHFEVVFNSDAINDSDIFTGSFPHNNLNTALKTVFETLNIKYNEKEKRNIKLSYKE